MLVNGVPASHPGQMVSPEEDGVLVDGEAVALRSEHRYMVLNKPRGYLTTLRDTHGRAHVLDLLGRSDERVYPVGRLDLDTEGLLLLTDDGDLAYRLTHPRFKIEKAYRVVVRGVPTPREVRRLEEGIVLEDGLTMPARARIVGTAGENAVLELTLKEGRKRQVKRMCRAIGYPVLGLRRTRVGPLRLGRLRPGAWRELSEEEIEALRVCAGLGGGSGDPE